MSYSINFNDPNFDPKKFNPLRPKVQPGMTFEEHTRIVAAGIKKLGIKGDKEADFTLLMKRTQEKISKVRAYANAVVDEHRMAGKDVDRVYLARDIQEQYLNAFKDYSKDDLFMAMVIFLSQLTLREVV